jgi:hypothetical protein
MFSKIGIGLRSKIITIASSFALPIMVLSYFTVNSVNYDIRFSTLEKYGNEYQRPLEAILKGVLDHEIALTGRVMGMGSKAGLTTYSKEVEAGFQGLEAVDQARGTDLQFTPEGPREVGKNRV